MMSTDKAPNHKLCPTGKEAWCKYNRALANGETPPPHKPTLTPAVGQLVFPVFKRLTDPALMERCSKMLTQNPNESFNAQVWNRCPKTMHATLQSIEIAMYLAVISFNVGASGLKLVFEKLGLTWGHVNSTAALKTEQTRIRHARRKSKTVSKWRRRRLHRLQLREEDTRTEKEGVTYSGGAFNDNV